MATAVYRTSYTVERRSRAGEHEGDMEGTTHASTGLLAGAGIALLTHLGHAHGVTAWEGVGRDLLYGAVAAGTALLPDADHPKASFAYSAGRLSRGISHVVAVATGGHRQGMHSVFGITAMSLGAEAAAVWFPNHWSLGVLAGLLAMCVAAGLAATGFARHGLEALALGCVLAGVAVASPSVRPNLWWLVALGMGLHVIEDTWTGHGVGLLWPFSTSRFGGDGRQPASRRRTPAKRRPAPRTPRKTDSQPAPPPKTRTGPWNPAKGLWQAMCGECLSGDHGDCTDRDCKCTQPGVAHPHRPVPKTVDPTAILPPEPPF